MGYAAKCRSGIALALPRAQAPACGGRGKAGLRRQRGRPTRPARGQASSRRRRNGGLPRTATPRLHRPAAALVCCCMLPLLPLKPLLFVLLLLLPLLLLLLQLLLLLLLSSRSRPLSPRFSAPPVYQRGQRGRQEPRHARRLSHCSRRQQPVPLRRPRLPRLCRRRRRQPSSFWMAWLPGVPDPPRRHRPPLPSSRPPCRRARPRLLGAHTAAGAPRSAGSTSHLAMSGEVIKRLPRRVLKDISVQSCD